MSLHLKYLNLGPLCARGGVVRFFLLAHGIEYEEELYVQQTGEWAEKKKEMLESGHYPAGMVPAVEVDGKKLTQHVAIMRYLAKTRDLLVGDAYAEFAQDAVSDQYQSFRNEWVTALLGDEKVKANFKDNILAKELTIMNGLYKVYKQDTIFLSVGKDSKPLWGDLAVFGLIYDLFQSGFSTSEDLESYEELSAMYKEVLKIPAVDAWIQGKKPSSE